LDRSIRLIEIEVQKRKQAIEEDPDSDDDDVVKPDGNAESPDKQSPPLMQGYLSRLIKQQWERKWFVLRRSVILIYKERDNTHNPIWAISLDEVEIQVMEVKGKSQYSFTIDQPMRKSDTLAAENEVELQKWLATLPKAITSRRGKIPPWTDPGSFCDSIQNIVKKGYVEIQEGNTWKKSFIILKENVLYITKSSLDPECSSAVDLDGYRVTSVESKKKNFLFQLHNPIYSTLLISAETKSERDIWLKEISGLISKYTTYNKEKEEKPVPKQEPAPPVVKEKPQEDKEKKPVKTNEQDLSLLFGDTPPTNFGKGRPTLPTGQTTRVIPQLNNSQSLSTINNGERQKYYYHYHNDYYRNSHLTP